MFISLALFRCWVFVHSLLYVWYLFDCLHFQKQLFLFPDAKNFKMDTRPPGYRRIELFEDGTIKTEVVWVDDK